MDRERCCKDGGGHALRERSALASLLDRISRERRRGCSLGNTCQCASMSVDLASNMKLQSMVLRGDILPLPGPIPPTWPREYVRHASESRYAERARATTIRVVA